MELESIKGLLDYKPTKLAELGDRATQLNFLLLLHTVLSSISFCNHFTLIHRIDWLTTPETLHLV